MTRLRLILGSLATFLCVELTGNDSGIAAFSPYNVKYFGAVGDGATDDTAAFSNAVARGGEVVVPFSSRGYVVSGISLTNNTRFFVQGKTRIILKTNTPNTWLIRNVNQTTGNQNIEIEGGIWDGNSLNQTNSFIHNFQFRECTNLFIHNVMCTNAIGFGIRIGDSKRVTVKDIVFHTGRDGLHCNGPFKDAFIQNIKGTATEDMVALNATDWVNYNETQGNIENVIIDGLFPDGSVTALRLYGGTLGGMTNITIRNVVGNTTAAAINASADTNGAFFGDNLLIDGISVSNNAQVITLGARWGNVVINNLRSLSSSAVLIPIGLDGSNSSISSLTINNAVIADGTGSAALVKVYANAAITNLTLNNIKMISGNCLVLADEGSFPIRIHANNLQVHGGQGFTLANDATILVNNVDCNPSGYFLNVSGSHTGTVSVANFKNRRAPDSMVNVTGGYVLTNYANAPDWQGDLVIENIASITRQRLSYGNSDVNPFLSSVNTAETFGWGFFNRSTEGNFQLQRKAGGAWLNTLIVDRSTGDFNIGATLTVSNLATARFGVASYSSNGLALAPIVITVSPQSITNTLKKSANLIIGGGIVTAISINGTPVGTGLALTGISTLPLQPGEIAVITYSSSPVISLKPF